MSSTKTVQWKSCSRGHVYLGRECPCEQFSRYKPREQQSSRPDGSPSSQLDAESPERPK
jgi:hypothetical protein